VVGIEDGRESNFTFQRLHIADTASLIFSLIGVALGTIAVILSLKFILFFNSFKNNSYLV